MYGHRLRSAQDIACGLSVAPRHRIGKPNIGLGFRHHMCYVHANVKYVYCWMLACGCATSLPLSKGAEARSVPSAVDSPIPASPVRCKLLSFTCKHTRSLFYCQGVVSQFSHVSAIVISVCPHAHSGLLCVPCHQLETHARRGRAVQQICWRWRRRNAFISALVLLVYMRLART